MSRGPVGGITHLTIPRRLLARRRGVKFYAPPHRPCSQGFALLFVHRNFLTDLFGVGDAFGIGLSPTST